MCAAKENFFIYKWKLAGLSNVSILRLISHCLEGNYWNYTQTELCEIAHLKGEQKENFISHYEQLPLNLEQDFFAEQATNFMTILDSAYPERLKEIYNPPAAFFYSGNIALLNQPSIAVIGSRQASAYGRQMVGKLVSGLMHKNITIVSGLARGVDTCAHQAAISYKLHTIGILGFGIDQIYPRENQQLQNYIGRHELLISEYPAGTKPLPYHFPQRNRIIAGLSLGTCVVEAKAHSGTLITAELALEAGREVFAVPGSCLVNTSEGCNRLIQQGAKPVWHAQQILEELAFALE